MITRALQILGLPTINIVNPVSDRVRVFKNLEDIISEINVDNQTKQYISKYIYSAANGLFDAALNYIWNAVELDIRNKIYQFDLEYFYEILNKDKLSTFEDLTKVQAYELLEGARKMELISEQTFLKLENIRNMRNHISSAHPNEADVTASELIEWLETAVKYVFEVKLSDSGLATKRLLKNIKEEEFSEEQVKAHLEAFKQLSYAKSSPLMKGFFGIFIKSATTEVTRTNIAKLAPKLWVYTDNKTKEEIGFNYGKLLLHNKADEINMAKRFIELVDGKEYLPRQMRETEIAIALDHLSAAHHNSNNFYTEPIAVRELESFKGVDDDMSEAITKKYVLTLVDVFLTNGWGISWAAEPVYIKLISGFNEKQARLALVSFTYDSIVNKLKSSTAQIKYAELLQIIKIKLTGNPLALLEKLDSMEPIQLKTAHNNADVLKQFKPLIEEETRYFN